MTNDSAPDFSSLRFEEALQRLEHIVEALENDPPGIEDAIQRYEEGIALVRLCQERLERAELRIQELRLE
jgi:exodeoxyribonuclease VII small subunit